MLRPRVLFFFAGLGLLFAIQATASLEGVSYPVTELGSCENQEACFVYCNDPLNFDACMSFAEANQLLTEEEIQTYQTAEQALAKNGGPGGCTNQAACEAYCSDIANMKECLSFANENGLMSEEELTEATRVMTALESGLSLPGGCTSKDSCDAYCGAVEHMEECLAFASAAGIISEEELGQAQNMLGLLKSGATPGGCSSRETCDAYCGDETHLEECLNFAVEANMMTPEQAAQAIERGNIGEQGEIVGPGGCDSEETCSAYCLDEANRQECETFFGEMGEAPEGKEEKYDEEYQSSFVGPGGCEGEEACMSFCLEPANQETCASFFGTQPETGEVFEQVVPVYEEGTEYKYESGTEYEYEGGTEYEYEGGSYEENYDDSHYDEPSAFEDFGPEDIPLDLEGEYDEDHLDSSVTQYDEIEVTPNSGESSSEESGETNEQADAGLMNSVKRLFTDFVLFLTL